MRNPASTVPGDGKESGAETAAGTMQFSADRPGSCSSHTHAPRILTHFEPPDNRAAGRRPRWVLTLVAIGLAATVADFPVTRGLPFHVALDLLDLARPYPRSFHLKMP